MLKTDMSSSLMHNFFADTSYCVIWNTTVVFVPYMVSTVYTIFFFNINMLSVHQDHITISLYIFRKAIPHHHRRLSHHADAPGPLGGRRGLGEVWSSIGMKRKEKEEAEQTKLVNTQRGKEKTDWNCGTKDQKTKGGPQKAVVMVWQPKLGVTKEKCGELKVKWESEGNFLKWHLFHILKTGKLRPKLLNHRCSMFFTRTILTILGLWNPRPNPDEVRKFRCMSG